MNSDDLRRAWAARSGLRGRLASEATDCYRLLHGATEGFPGITVDVYGTLLLIQCHRQPLGPECVEGLLLELPLTAVVCWGRQEQTSRVLFAEGDLEPRWVREFGLEYWVEARPRRLDPQLFLDTRAVRRWLRERHWQSALNLFCYTGSLGLAAGAKDLWQVDFSASALETAGRNGERNGRAAVLVQQEIYPVLWQLSGRPVKRRPTPPKLEARQFELIVLDPPQRSKGHYGAVDIKNDYQSLFRPCLDIIAPGGTIIATNNLAAVGEDEFLEMLQRCARKAGREWHSHELLRPEEDFPSPDGRPPLKIAAMQF